MQKVDKGLIHFYHVQTIPSNIFKKYLNNPRTEKTLAPIPILNESVYTEWTETCQLTTEDPSYDSQFLLTEAIRLGDLDLTFTAIGGFQFSIENIYRLAFLDARDSPRYQGQYKPCEPRYYKNNILRNLDV